jgi:hypothetical protein
MRTALTMIKYLPMAKKAANRPMARASRIVKVSKRLGHKTDILYDETCNAAGSFRLDAQRADGPAY